MVRVDGVGIVDIYSPKSRELIIKEITEQWEDWIYLSGLSKRTKLIHIRDKAEFNALTQPYKAEFDKLGMQLATKKIEYFEKSILRSIDKYQIEDLKINKEYNEKVIKDFKTQIKKLKSHPETVAKLTDIRDRFLEFGLCVNTGDNLIEKTKAKIQLKRIKIYNKFKKVYDKNVRVILPYLERLKKRKGAQGLGCAKLYKLFVKDEAMYTQLGNKFPEAEISIIKPADYAGTEFHSMKMYVDDVEVKGFKLINKRKGPKDQTRGFAPDRMIVKLPLYYGQKIRIHLAKNPNASLRSNMTFSVCCHISLSKNRSYILCNKASWRKFSTKQSRSWLNEKKDKESNYTYSILKEYRRQNLYQRHVDGSTSFSYGMIYLLDDYNTYFMTEVIPENITLTHIPMSKKISPEIKP